MADRQFGPIPCLAVLKRETLPAAEAIERVTREGKSGFSVMDADDLDRFEPIERIALVTHHPEALAKNACFSLPGSRCGDRRVAALWISKGAPKLGWCWAGNPHTWLGSASCGGRTEV